MRLFFLIILVLFLCSFHKSLYALELPSEKFDVSFVIDDGFVMLSGEEQWNFRLSHLVELLDNNIKVSLNKKYITKEEFTDKIMKLSTAKIKSKPDEKYKMSVCKSLKEHEMYSLETYANFIEPTELETYKEACDFYFDRYLRLHNDLLKISKIFSDDRKYLLVSDLAQYSSQGENTIIIMPYPIIHDQPERMPPEVLLRGGLVHKYINSESKTIFISYFQYVGEDDFFKKYARNTGDVFFIYSYVTWDIASSILNLCRDIPNTYIDKQSVMFPGVQFDYYNTYRAKAFYKYRLKIDVNSIPYVKPSPY